MSMPSKVRGETVRAFGIPKLQLSESSSDSQSGPVYRCSSPLSQTSTLSWGVDSEGDYPSTPRQEHKKAINDVPKTLKPSLPISNASSPASSDRYADLLLNEMADAYRKGSLLQNEPRIIQREAKRPRKVMDARCSTIGLEAKEHKSERFPISFSARLLVFESNKSLHVKGETDMRGDKFSNSLSSWKLRNFHGIAYPSDSTLTILEDHCLGKNMVPIPFLPRAIYHCANSLKTDQAYMPETDLFPGALLFIRYPNPESAPGPLRRFLDTTHGVIRLRITEVDRTARLKALENELQKQKVPADLWYSVMAKLHVVRLMLPSELWMRLLKLQSICRKVIRSRSRPIEAFMQLNKFYMEHWQRCIDSETVRKCLEQGMHRFRLPELNVINLNTLWKACSIVSGSNTVPHYSDYLNLAFGDLPERRRRLVVKAFTKMDPIKSGHVNILDLKKFYSTPKWLDTALNYTAKEFESLFREFSTKHGSIDFCSFEAFYLGLHIALGDSTVDEAKNLEDPTVLVTAIQEEFNVEDAEPDLFERVIRDSWSMYP